MTSTEIVHRFIATFVDAWPQGDADRLGPFFSPDAVYHNMPMDPVVGREAIVATLADFMGMGGEVSVDLVHIIANGGVVLTERVDHFVGPESSISLPVMGIIETGGDVITAWRDYFDLAGFTPPDPA